MRREYAKSATIILTADGRTASCSCRLERDPGHLCYNRISLLGDKEAWRRVLPLQRTGEVDWTLYENERWYPEQGASQRTVTSGTAFIRSLGMMEGVSVHPDGIQDFADLEILEFVETHRFAEPSNRRRAIEYTFLQRPRDWFPHKRRLSLAHGLTRRGDWFQAGSVRFRSVLHGELRDDSRLSREVELIGLPGFELESVGHLDFDGFAHAAERLWFCLRIAVSFRYRQLLHPLRTFTTRENEFSIKWMPQAVEPRESDRDAYREGPIRGSTQSFFAQGARRLLLLYEHRESLHAAVYGYATSYSATLVEGRLTACVEALERLLGVFERIHGLDREIIDKKIWRRAGAQLRKAVDGLELTPAQAAAVRQNLASPVTMTLQDRLERMVRRYRKGWSTNDLSLAKLDSMILLRNHIVHGRIITDYQSLHIETLRAQTLFELLFLAMLGCHAFVGSGHSRWTIRAHDNVGSSPVE